MTIDEFVAMLAYTPGPWQGDERFNPMFYPRLRCDYDGRYCCPITVLGQQRWPARYVEDAKRLGLSEADATKIAVTADGWLTHPAYCPVLRKRLETATVNRFTKAA